MKRLAIQGLPAALAAWCITLSAAGCTNVQAVIVPWGQAVILAEKIRAKTFVNIDGEWVRTDTRSEIAAGWLLVPLTTKELTDQGVVLR